MFVLTLVFVFTSPLTFFFFNTSLLQRYTHGAFEDMRHWYIQHFVSNMNMK